MDRAVDRLNAMHEQECWQDEIIDQLQAVIDDASGSVYGALGLCEKPEPLSSLAWFEVFPSWFALVPADLKLPVLRELQSERPVSHQSRMFGGGTTTYMRESWLKGWLHSLASGRASLPDGLTQETVGVIVQAIIDNRTDLASIEAFCDGC